MDLRRITTALLALAIVAAACGGGDDEPTPSPAPGTQPAATTSSDPSAPPAPPDASASSTTERPAAPGTTAPPSAATTEAPPPTGPFEILTADGLILEAERFGTGQDFVVLAHMRPADMSSWFSFAGFLGDEGYSAITFNFRGYGNSEGAGFAVDTDVVAAVDAAFELGAGRVFVIGASMGGTGAIAAAAQRDVAGVITLSAPAEFQGTDALAAAAAAQTAMLLIAAEGDAPYNAHAAQLEAAAGGFGDVAIYPGSKHGTDMFLDHSESLTQAILMFLAAQP